MKTVHLKKWAYMYADRDIEDRDDPIVILLDDDLSSDDKWALIKEVDIEVQISESFDPRPVQVAGLREALVKVRAEAEKNCTEIQSKINKLLAI